MEKVLTDKRKERKQNGSRQAVREAKGIQEMKGEVILLSVVV